MRVNLPNLYNTWRLRKSQHTNCMSKFIENSIAVHFYIKKHPVPFKSSQYFSTNSMALFFKWVQSRTWETLRVWSMLSTASFSARSFSHKICSPWISYLCATWSNSIFGDATLSVYMNSIICLYMSGSASGISTLPVFLSLVLCMNMALNTKLLKKWTVKLLCLINWSI